MAQDAEKACRWDIAAIYWRKALHAYPLNVGGLAMADMTRIAERLKECERMARNEESK
jgi:hypothetical protein